MARLTRPPPVPLSEALDILAAFARDDDPRYEKAALRWIGRYALEVPGVAIEDVTRAATWLDVLPDQPEVIEKLRELVAPAG